MPDPFASQAWAWAQSLPPERKIVLLALCAGDAEPTVPDLGTRTGLGPRQVGIALEELHRADLIDDDFRPKVSNGT